MSSPVINLADLKPGMTYSIIIDGKTRYIKVHPGGHITIQTSP